MSDIKNLLDQIRSNDAAAPITLNSILTSKISERIDQFKQDFVNRTFNGVRENIEDYSLEEINEWMLSEEYEQLDELSKTTLGNYIKKAGSGVQHHAHVTGLTKSKEAEEFHSRKSNKRLNGINTAVKKLVKESESKE